MEQAEKGRGAPREMRPGSVMSVLLARHAGSQPRNRYMSSQTL